MSFELFEEDESSELMLCADGPTGRCPRTAGGSALYRCRDLIYPHTGNGIRYNRYTDKGIRYCGKPAFMIVLVNYGWKGGRVCRYNMNR